MQQLDSGTNLKNLRMQRKLTRRKLAELLGVKYTTWSNYENNYREPNIEMLKVIANYFSISVDSLLNIPNIPSGFIEKSPEILTVIAEANKMSISDLRLVIKLIYRLNDSY